MFHACQPCEGIFEVYSYWGLISLTVSSQLRSVMVSFSKKNIEKWLDGWKNPTTLNDLYSLHLTYLLFQKCEPWKHCHFFACSYESNSLFTFWISITKEKYNFNNIFFYFGVNRNNIQNKILLFECCIFKSIEQKYKVL